MSDPGADALAEKLDRLEEAFNKRWDADSRRADERHQEVVRRLGALEVQTTQTNGTVSELQIKEAVRERLEQQAESFKTKYDREADKRGDRTRGWWMIVFAYGLGFAGALVLSVIQIVRSGTG